MLFANKLDNSLRSKSIFKRSTDLILFMYRLQCDASKLDELDKLFAQIKKEARQLDSLFANAGVSKEATLGSITEELFDNIFDVNVKVVLFTVQQALPICVDGGSIILNGSNLSIKGFPGTSVYSATKAAIRSFARCWTVDLKERKIRVNVVSPGPIDTPMLRNVGRSEEENKALIYVVKTATVLGRVGTPDEIATVVVFLASNDSSYVTGIELFADGGLAQV